ncbi:MAG: D-alanine--D-alanine ligase [Campylobacterota bacterium]
MKIAIVFGGISYEHEISIVSSIAMKDVLKDELIYIFLDENREFYHIPTDIIKSNLFSKKEYKNYDKLKIAKNGFYKKGGLLSKDKALEFDVALTLMHGGDGEDGVIASLFEFYNIPYLAPRVEACSVSSNKFLTKGYAKEVGVNVIDYDYFSTKDSVKVAKYPVIIKPVKLGSSIGVSIVKSDEQLQYALDVAFELDSAIIIEPFVANIKEYNLAGTKIGDEYEFSIIEEPQKAEFLDFDKKYLDFSRTSKAKEAQLDEYMKQKIKEAFKKVYNNIFEGSIIRCDFFVIDNEVYLNEINSIPGSMANYLFDDFNDLFKQLCLNLPKRKHIPITYDYVNKIEASKGK